MDEELRRKIMKAIEDIDGLNSDVSTRIKELRRFRERCPEYIAMTRAIRDSERLTAEDYAVTINCTDRPRYT
ncbi:MAG: hypothetical protein ACP5NS_02555 [Candidatus Pacearchaeota archaeon]